jgi:hypothetical protein
VLSLAKGSATTTMRQPQSTYCSTTATRRVWLELKCFNRCFVTNAADAGVGLAPRACGFVQPWLVPRHGGLESSLAAAERPHVFAVLATNKSCAAAVGSSHGCMAFLALGLFPGWQDSAPCVAPRRAVLRFAGAHKSSVRPLSRGRSTARAKSSASLCAWAAATVPWAA